MSEALSADHISYLFRRKSFGGLRFAHPPYGAELNENNQGETSQQQLTKPQFFSTELSKDINTTINAINQGNDHFFSSIIKSSKGDLHIAAEIKTNGTQLQFSALTVYPYEGKIQKNSILKDILSIKKELIKAAKENGFTEIKIIAERVKNSSSAHPGKQIDTIIQVK